MITCRNTRKTHLVPLDVRDWPVWRGGLYRYSRFKHVVRTRYYRDRAWEFPRDLAKIIIAYAQEPRMIYVFSNGDCPMCDPEDGGPEWPCEWHDEPQSNPDHRHIRLRDLRIRMIHTGKDDLHGK